MGRFSRFCILVLCTSVLLGGLSFAAEYPARPVTLVIPFPAGGSTDVTGRALAHAVRKYLGQPLVIENKGGGGGTVGPSLVLTKEPDGYTLGILPVVAVLTSWHMGKLNFNPLEGLTHILRYTGYTYGLVVRADAPWKNLEEYVKDAKRNPQKISYGSPGVGSASHLFMEEFASLAGMQLTHMPYKGWAEAYVGLLGGHIDSVSDSSGWAPLVDGGKFRLLVTYGEQRMSRYPQVPTLREVGYNMGVQQSGLEIIAPKGLPRAITAKVHDAFKKAMEDPDYQSTLKKLDMANIYLKGEDAEKAFRQESEMIGRIVQKLGLQKKQ